MICKVQRPSPQRRLPFVYQTDRYPERGQRRAQSVSISTLSKRYGLDFVTLDKRFRSSKQLVDCFNAAIDDRAVVPADDRKAGFTRAGIDPKDECVHFVFVSVTTIGTPPVCG